MVSLFNGKPTNSLACLRYNCLSKKVVSATTFVSPERLPPTASATKFHCLRTYLQVMVWMDSDEGMNPVNWGWSVEGDELVPIMMDKSPAPQHLLKVIHCSCKSGCRTLRCNCRKYGFPCTAACGLCQTDYCDNVTSHHVAEEDDEDE